FIFGGAGIRIDRNDIGMATEDAGGNILTDIDGHARDADFIMGDNANVYRLVDSETDAFLNFNYDNGYRLQIIPRAMEQLDYTLGGADYNEGTYVNGAAQLTGQPVDNGAADLIYGEAGDDIIFGMTGSDILFGDGQDDDIIGGYGHDWISGGTGRDGILGDDGLILTSRNSTAGEPLYGIEGLLAKDPRPKYADGNVLDETIKTPGDIQYAVINQSGELKKTVDIVPFSYDSTWEARDDEFPDSKGASPYADDIIFGGLGSDWLHGGSGDDAISGAEALEHAYVPTYDNEGNPNGILNLGYDAVGLPATTNPGNVLAFNPMDTDGQHVNNRFRAGEFALYDEYDPRLKIMLDSTGNLWKSIDQGDAYEFLLNFNTNEGVIRPAGTVPKATGQQTEEYPQVWDDGGDAIFGDLGNDWLVGGTGADNLYGGWGNDLLNADDDHSTNGNLNDMPDTHPFYQDRAYGGAGRDVLIGNTGGDRLIDWVGEYNSYLVPYAPFGQASVSRTLQPFLPEFLYALSAGDGADFTRPGDTGASEPRNGEPDAEMGLVLQKDFAWQDQTGAPADPQAGNIPGGARDVLRSAGFNDGTSDAFFVDSGVWSAVNGRYKVAPAFLGGDALSVFYVDEYIPSYFEMLATISAVKPTGGYNANSYLVFDYQSSEDFKFAGINVSTSKLEIGYRDASGWHVAVQAPYTGSMKADTDYNVFLALNGSTATLRVDNKVTLTYTFAARVDEYGIQHFLNEGMVGLGAKNAKAQIDNVVAQRIAPQTTFQKTVNFSSQADVNSLFQGNLTIADGVHSLTAAPGDTAVDLVDMQIAPASVLALETIFNTANQGGFVFDYYGPEDFKFVAVSVETGKVLVGHSTSRAGVAVDAEWSATLSADTDYKLGITIAERSVSVTLDGRAVSSYSFNALVTDGEFGLLARNGEVVFDSFMIMTDDPALAGITPVLPTVSILDASILEGNDGSQAVSLTLTLSAASTEVVTVDYATADSTAFAGEDYEQAAGTVTFAKDETTREITFQVYGDILFEPDETFDVVLSNASNAVILDGTGTIAILNDDEDSAPALSVSNASIQEGDDGFTSEVTVTVTLSAASTEVVTVNYATVEDTAFAGEDYEHAAGTVTFAAGETTKDITFRVYGDTLFEDDETFGIELSDAVGAAIAEGLGTVTILNDDVDPDPPALPTIFVSNASVIEGNDGSQAVNLTLTLSAASTEVVTVDYATVEDTAFAGEDYEHAAGTVTFAAGETTKDITFQVYGDTLFEDDETFNVVLSNVVNAAIAEGTGVITIFNDDVKTPEPPPAADLTVLVSNVRVNEGVKTTKTSVTI
ncbi:MAG: Calx-beta domain-containing protein, partial [Desulfobacterales bacterium]|nr:Calx-beta domain-containing protein [Desulfobacterales bacterium]